MCRALIREFEASAVRSGATALIIHGIPGFYRQFGFDYAISFPLHRPVSWEQSREQGLCCASSGLRYAATKVPRGCEGGWIARRSTRFCTTVDVYAEHTALELGTLCSVPIVDATGQSLLSAELYDVRADCGDEVVGQFAVTTSLWGALVLRELWLHDSHRAALACALATLRGVACVTGLSMAVATPPQPEVAEMLRALAGDEDPTPYAWYVRIPQPVKLLRDLRPAMERRAAAAGLRGVSVLLSFYDPHMDTALVSVGDDGRVSVEARGFSISHGGPEYSSSEQLVLELPHGAAARLMLGYCTMGELRRMYPDVWGHRRSFEVCSVLFPKLSVDVCLTV
eukprot:m51a1_g13292 hypothetical protein (340) ;mRNA; r:1487-2506